MEHACRRALVYISPSSRLKGIPYTLSWKGDGNVQPRSPSRPGLWEGLVPFMYGYGKVTKCFPSPPSPSSASCSKHFSASHRACQRPSLRQLLPQQGPRKKAGSCHDLQQALTLLATCSMRITATLTLRPPPPDTAQKKGMAAAAARAIADLGLLLDIDELVAARKVSCRVNHLVRMLHSSRLPQIEKWI